MSADANIKTIMRVYEAFGRGDVAAILDAVTSDVDWAAEADPTVAPWHGVRHGRDAVATFFTEFGTTMEVEEFTPVSLAANDTDVLSVGRDHWTCAAPGWEAVADHALDWAAKHARTTTRT
jgi:uncharacterized protein